MSIQTKTPPVEAPAGLGEAQTIVGGLPDELTRRSADVANDDVVALSYGRNTYDNLPQQRSFGSFAEFREFSLRHASDGKGKWYVCAPFREGENVADPQKHRGIKPWRCAEYAEPRRWFPFDLDFVRDQAALDGLLAAVRKYNGFAYTTASSTPEKPRCRIVIELARCITREEGKLLGPALEAEFTEGLDRAAYEFDPSVYRGEQPVYLPTQHDKNEAPTQNWSFGERALDPDGPLLAARLDAIEDEPEWEPELSPADALGVDVHDALKYIPADDRDVWRNVGMALHATGKSEAFVTWNEWSKQSPKYDEAGQRKTWASFHDRKDGIGIGTLFKLAKENGWVRPKDPTAPKATIYKLLSATEVEALPPMAWRIKGVLPARGLAQVYGPPASGKSFLAFDMGAAVALGEPWFDYRVSQAPVTYVALEGEAGFKQRIEAWKRQHHDDYGFPAALRLVLQPLRITKEADVQALADAIVEVAGKGGVTIVDTQNRAAPDADENHSGDMGLILEGAKRLADLTEGIVVLVAHSGKDEARGVRGHSSQLAAMDATIAVARDGDRREWVVGKSKDGVDGARHGFRLEVVKLGKDADGDERTSCVVVRDDSAPAKKLTRSEQFAVKTYVEACTRGLGLKGETGFAGLPVESWRNVYYEMSTGDLVDGKKRAFKRGRDDLVRDGFATVRDDVYRVTLPEIQTEEMGFAKATGTKSFCPGRTY